MSDALASGHAIAAEHGGFFALDDNIDPFILKIKWEEDGVALEFCPFDDPQGEGISYLIVGEGKS